MRYSLAWSSPDFAVATSSSSAISGYVGASRLASATLRLRGARFDVHYMSGSTMRQGKGVKLLCPARLHLPHHFVEQHAGGDCDVERRDPPTHRQPHQDVAVLAHKPTESLPLAAHHQRKRRQ